MHIAVYLNILIFVSFCEVLIVKLTIEVYDSMKLNTDETIENSGSAVLFLSLGIRLTTNKERL